MRFFKLVKLLIVGNIKAEKFLAFLSIVGIALGIGLFIGVKAASDRAVASFEADIRGVSRGTNYEIADASGIDFDDRIYGEIVRREQDAFPGSKVNGYIPGIRESVSINGIYTVRALRLFGLPSQKDIDIVQFFRTRNGVFITKDFSEKYSLKRGDRIPALVYDRKYLLRVVDIIDAGALAPNTVLMDLGNFQDYFGRAGSLSRIDLKADDATAERIRALLPTNLYLEKKEEIVKSRESIVASFRYNLQFVSLIAILVGIFLLYNTVFISVVKRRTEIGILRGLGIDKRTVIMLFLFQGLFLGLIGSVIGIGLGQVAAYFSGIAVEKTISTMYSAISIHDYLISKSDALRALILGVCVSLIASAVPSYESSKIRPNESIKEGTFESRFRGRQGFFSSLGLLCILSGGALSYLDYRFMPFQFPFPAYAGILFIIAGFTFISPAFLSTVLSAILAAVRYGAGRIFKPAVRIALGDMRGNIYRFSVALMSVAISCALIIALLTLISSFRNSLKAWIQRNIAADVYIKPASCASNFCFFPLSEEIVALVKGFPEVEGVDKFRTLSLDLFGRKVVAAFGDVAVERRFAGRRGADSGTEARDRELEQEKAVSISNYLSIKYGLKRGDTIDLRTPAGVEKFTVNDTFSSYSTTSGFIYFDRRWLRKYWGLDDATQLAVYLKKGADADRFIRKLNDRLSGVYSLEIMNNSELRRKVLGIFNKTFSITYAIELISIVVSLIGVVNTLMTLVLERKREISIIRYLGGDWNQIRQILVFSAGVVGLGGIFLGVIMGLMMSVIFIQVINKVSFGWGIHFMVPLLSLSVVAVLLFLTTVFAGLLPAKVARKIDPKRFISFE